MLLIITPGKNVMMRTRNTRSFTAEFPKASVKIMDPYTAKTPTRDTTHRTLRSAFAERGPVSGSPIPPLHNRLPQSLVSPPGKP
jgi:hypothetical protein